MNRNTFKMIELALRADQTVSESQRTNMIRLIRSADKGEQPGVEARPSTPLLTPKAAASYLGVSKRTLARYVSSGRLVPGRINGRVLRFRRDDLDRLVFGHVDQ